MKWSVTDYRKFEEERTRPVLDLLARIPAKTVTAAVDLGCGPGNSTEALQVHYPGAFVSAIDTSAEMIEAARQRLPDVHFENIDIAAWSSKGPFDVILASASLHWVPDHEVLLPSLVVRLAPAGSLAVQIPDNLEEPVHHLMREIASDLRWAEKLSDAARPRSSRHSPEWYFLNLRDHVSKLDVWRTIYYYPLAGHEAVTEWFRGTGLLPFLDRLNATEQTEFLASFQAGIARAYPALDDGTVVLPLPRLFFVGTR